MSMVQSENGSHVVEYTLSGAVGLTDALINQLSEALDLAEDAGEGTILLIRVQGTPSLATTQAWPGAATTNLVNKWLREIRRLERARSSTLVFMSGYCTTVALELLLAADYRIADQEAHLQCRSAGNHAWPGMSLYRLVQHLGVAGARRLTQRESPLTAAECNEFLIVDTQWEGGHIATAEVVAAAGFALGSETPMLRRLMLDASKSSYDDALGLHLAACERVMRQYGNAEDAPRAAAMR